VKIPKPRPRDASNESALWICFYWDKLSKEERNSFLERCSYDALWQSYKITFAMNPVPAGLIRRLEEKLASIHGWGSVSRPDFSWAVARLRSDFSNWKIRSIMLGLMKKIGRFDHWLSLLSEETQDTDLRRIAIEESLRLAQAFRQYVDLYMKVWPDFANSELVMDEIAKEYPHLRFNELRDVFYLLPPLSPLYFWIVEKMRAYYNAEEQ